MLGKLRVQSLVFAVEPLYIVVEIADNLVEIRHGFLEEGNFFLNLHDACVVIHIDILIR